MKKIFNVLVLAIFAACMICLAGCEASADYEERIIKLEEALAKQTATNDEYDSLIVDYEDRIASLETEVNRLKTTSKQTTTKLAEDEAKLSKLEGDVENMVSASDTSIKVYLADQYYLVVGDTFQLFFRSVIRAVDPYGYYLRVTGDQGYTYTRYFEFTPTTAGTFNLKLEVCDNNGNVLGEDSTKLIVADKKKTTDKEKTILCIGDSLTSSGDWVSRGISKYKTAGGVPTTVGTIKKTVNSVQYNYEGRAGWQWSSYLGRYDSSTVSPFTVDGTNPSIRDYCTRNGFGEITDFYIMMTFNGLPGTFTEFTFDTTFIKQAKQLIDLIHSEYPNAKITLMNLPLTSTYSGLGAYYGVSKAYGDNYGKAVTVYHYGDFLESWCKLPEYKSFMRYLDIKAQFDSEYNMPYEQKNVNTTNSSVKEPYGTSMGMHPTVAGYNQIGDAVYRALMSNW